MDFKNEIISVNIIKITLFFIVIQAITQYAIILFFLSNLSNYNKFLIRQFFFLIIQLIKNQFYKKINNYLNFFNKVFRQIIIILIELLIMKKKNLFIIKYLFKCLKKF